jgi:hypothetical protein
MRQTFSGVTRKTLQCLLVGVSVRVLGAGRVEQRSSGECWADVSAEGRTATRSQDLKKKKGKNEKKKSFFSLLGNLNQKNKPYTIRGLFLYTCPSISLNITTETACLGERKHTLV